MLCKLAIIVALVLTTSLALMSNASARIPEPFGSSSPSISAAVRSSANVAGFTATGSPFAYLSTLFAGDPAAYGAQPTAFGGGGSYAAPPAPGSNIHVLGLQP